MIRTQVQLTEHQVRELRKRAAERGVSMATLIRDAIDLMLAADDRHANWERAMAAVGKFRSGLSDISKDHDRYLAEDFMDWKD